MRNISKFASAVALLVCGCATDSRQAVSGGAYMEREHGQFKAQLNDCSKTYNYDPDNPPKLGEHELAPTERAWRSCVYDGVRKYLIPASVTPGLYENLITTDQILTDNIEKKLITRSQRKNKIDEMISYIDSQEANNIITQDPRAKGEELDKKTKFTRGMVYQLRRGL